MTYYSALHYAAKAEKSAKSAEDYSSKAENAANRAEGAVLPSQTGNDGKVLMTDGTSPFWGEYKSSNHVVVSVLPAEPDEDTFYYIPE